ncbi:type VI secretion system protein ImpJ [Methylomagnum ishizawai]|uniref:Type VI secretion system protein ImpJ n=2 Tax=Methylomagnum ishizawai TaxID=1760988 RepID=A0A1Y6D2U2_9GAMM|nr:type VI secretion system protein ImpJ [Methylomagnum ishizawai]
MGQTLLPGHLSALEESLLADAATRFGLQGLPNHGLAGLRWNETLLAEGVLSLEALCLLLPSGLLLELGGNARAEPLNLNAAAGTLLPVYLHVRNPPGNQGERDDLRPTVERDGIACWLWRLELSTEQENPDTRESFRLADFEKLPEGSWRLAARYIPPLLLVGAVPFLAAELRELKERLDAFYQRLTQDIAAIYLSGEHLINAKQCLKSVLRLQRFLVNLMGQIPRHPYEVYEELKRFYIDLCFYHENPPQFATEAYRHERLAEVFAQILIPLCQELQLNQSRSAYLPFEPKAGVLQVALPPAIREAQETYLLVQKGRVSQAASLNGIKLAAVSRIPVVHKFYLQGISYKHIERPPFQHSFGPEVDIYQLAAGEEWDHALRELTVGFYADPVQSEAKFFLYWRAH